MPQSAPSPKRRKKKKPKKRKDPWQLLVIAAFFLMIGMVMVLARRGELRPVPAGQRGETPSVAAMSAEEMRAYGWFGIACGLSSVGIYVWLRLKKRK
jgi:hypothetical protein